MKNFFTVLLAFAICICVSSLQSCSGDDQQSDHDRIALLDSLSRTIAENSDNSVNTITLSSPEPTLVSASKSSICIQLPSVVDGPSVRTFSISLSMEGDSVTSFSCKASSGTTPPSQPPPAGKVYIIKQGDTETSLYQRFGVRIKNPQQGKKIYW